MRCIYWIKFLNTSHPQRYSFDTFEEFWQHIRELMIRDPNRYGPLEWMIRD